MKRQNFRTKINFENENDNLHKLEEIKMTMTIYPNFISLILCKLSFSFSKFIFLSL